MANVLVVEPDGALCAALCALLADGGGHAVTAATTGREAVACLTSRRAGRRVVLLDADLPGPVGAAGVLVPAARQLLPRHAYVLLACGAPDALPLALRVLGEALAVPVVSLPTDRRDLLALVAAAARLLDDDAEAAVS
jgi:CheY-like chemotaxis protein